MRPVGDCSSAASARAAIRQTLMVIVATLSQGIAIEMKITEYPPARAALPTYTRRLRPRCQRRGRHDWMETWVVAPAGERAPATELTASTVSKLNRITLTRNNLADLLARDYQCRAGRSS
jgi:hypothetical protein